MNEWIFNGPDLDLATYGNIKGILFLGPGLPPNAWVIFPEDGKISETNQHAQLTARPVNFSQSIASKLRHRCEIFGFFSSRSLKTREKYISFAQFVYFLKEVCLLFNFEW